MKRQNQIGLIGLGKVGSRIAKRILISGRSLMIFDKDRSRTNLNMLYKATVAINPKELATFCDIILLSLPNPQIVRKVIFESGGILSSDKHNRIIVDLSTNSPEDAKIILANCQLHKDYYLDAPITGGIYGIEKGNATIIIGGNYKQIVKIKPILKTFANKIIHMGPVGHGVATKLIHNMLGEIQVYSIAEAFALAAKLKLDLNAVYSVLSNGMASSKILTELYAKGGLIRNFEPRASVGLASKDQKLLIKMANEAGIDLVFTPIVIKQINQVIQMGLEKKDVTSALLLFEKKHKVKIKVRRLFT